MSHPSRVRELKRELIVGERVERESHPSRVRELKHTTDGVVYVPTSVAPLPGA